VLLAAGRCFACPENHLRTDMPENHETPAGSLSGATAASRPLANICVRYFISAIISQSPGCVLTTVPGNSGAGLFFQLFGLVYNLTPAYCFSPAAGGVFVGLILIPICIYAISVETGDSGTLPSLTPPSTFASHI